MKDIATLLPLDFVRVEFVRSFRLVQRGALHSGVNEWDLRHVPVNGANSGSEFYWGAAWYWGAQEDRLRPANSLSARI